MKKLIITAVALSTLVVTGTATAITISTERAKSKQLPVNVYQLQSANVPIQGSLNTIQVTTSISAVQNANYNPQ